MVMSVPSSACRSRVTAVLGPTNTGKTHLAMERLLGHASGMIGFPLRLLARENYDRAVRIKGARSVALITGEEKIIPPDARYFLCTVESMPVTRRVAFLAIDEIQVCADPDRGHVFTDRLLHARGTLETMFTGSETVRALLRRLVPEAEIVTRPRFSTLSYGGQRKIQRLPARTAIVAFTAHDVYAIAELIRRQRGGAAVVLGALSPRTRNAQVAIYQAGEVDYLVATDAIGMGLNMDINHVAFAATRKFDGRLQRALSAAELAQIAGRAGRHTNDGTFGTTAEVGPLDAETAERIENHCFRPLQSLFWRNSDLAFASVDLLRASLARPPDRPGLMRARAADDEQVLAVLARDPEVSHRASGREAVHLLWQVCQIPDFRKVMSEAHARLLAHIYRYLTGAGGPGERCLPTDWVARQVERINRTDGDIDTLMQRIANIRTWTYVSYHGDWLHDAGQWQERTRAIEDRLSDALHDRLIQRFVDRRTSLLVGRMRGREALAAVVNAAGEVLVEGEFVGTLEGFRFVPDPAIGPRRPGGSDIAHKVISAAASRALRGEIAARVRRIEAEPSAAFSLTGERRVLWRGVAIGELAAGHHILHPCIEVTASELLPAEGRERVRRRLSEWLDGHLESRLAPLYAAGRAPLPGPARGLVYQTAEALGSVPRRRVAAQIAALSRADRRTLGALGLRIGRESVYFTSLTKPDAIALRCLLWAVYHRRAAFPGPAPGRVSLGVDARLPSGLYEAAGYRVLGRLAMRVDMLERLAARAAALSRGGAFAITSELLSLAGCSAPALTEVLCALGYRAEPGPGGVSFRGAGNGPRRRPGGAPGSRRGDAGSPFAKLRQLATPR